MLKSKNLLIVSLFVSFITLLVYLPALQNDFVNWDDNEYIYDNPYIQSFDLKSIKWMFTTFHAANWHPLAWLSHAIDYAVWNLNPMGHHLTSIVLHGLNTFLVVILITQLVSFGRNYLDLQFRISDLAYRQAGFGFRISLLAGAITGLLFGLHPLHVESVAWVSERKDVLYAFFFLLSILTYLRYTSSSGKRGFFYSACLFFFILSLMSKPMAVTLPAVLILLDWYPLKRFEFKLALTLKRRVLIEKLPFFVLSLITSVLTLMAQQAGGSVATIETLSFVKRMLIAVRALGLYLFKFLWPLNLAPFYPYPSEDSMLVKEFIMAAIVVFFITAFCIYLWRRQRVWSVVWVYYLVTLLPVLGIIKVGDQAAADRYTYLPSLGPFLLIGLGVGHIMRNVDTGKSDFFLRKVNGFVLILAIMFIFLVNLNIKQQRIWKTSESLWEANIKQYPQSAYKAYNNLGYAYKSQGNIVRAIENYKIALKINPNHDHAHNNLGVALESQGHFDKAIEHYERAIKINPEYSWPYYNLGHIYQVQNQMTKAIEYYQTAIRMNQKFSNAYYNLGQIYQSQGQIDNAIKYYKSAVKFNPFYYDAYNNLGIAYNFQGFIDKAIEQYHTALTVKPDFKKAHMNIGFAYFKKGDIKRAIYHLEYAIKLDPNDSKAHLNLAIAYKSKGLIEKANDHFRIARQLNPEMFK